MTHQPNKHFNTYKEGLDLEFLREYCMEHGERRVMERGETLEEAGEPTQWVAEWLSNEETVCLTNADFTRLQELFRFNGIPHYETITPDGRRVRDDLQLQGFYNFDYELTRLKERLK